MTLQRRTQTQHKALLTANAMFGAQSTVARAMAAIQAGIEAAAGFAALGNQEWVAAANHFTSAKMYADVARTSTPSGGGVADRFDPLQAQNNQPQTTIIVTRQSQIKR